MYIYVYIAAVGIASDRYRLLNSNASLRSEFNKWDSHADTVIPKQETEPYKMTRLAV